MTAKSRANLKAVFETGDTPTGRDFEDLIDSFVTLTDTTANSLAGNLTVPGVAANTVSAGTVYADNVFNQGLSTHKNPYAEAYTEVTAITSIEATATWTLVCGALTAPNVAGFSVSGHDVIYTGSVTARFVVDVQLDTRTSANANLWLAIAKNSTVVSGSISKLRHAAGLHSNATRAVMELKTNDVVNLRMQNPDGPISSPEALTVKYLVHPIYWP